ncbi:MAG: hypothetical protein ACD_72C00152G0002 [uncultured bacterium]|nr:MAG: hypothetical protein ACD_72C00152G0002 [uncultured bacterium]
MTEGSRGDTQKRALHREKSEVKAKIDQGKCAIELFNGQSVIFIPRAVFEKLGPARVRELAVQVFGEERLGHFSSQPFEMESSYTMELPPQLKPNMTQETFDETLKDNQVAKYAELLETEAQK